MMARERSGNATAAQIRGDIDRGRTGDKRPGFDPAAAPMETDGEAGGAPMSPQQVAAGRQPPLQRRGDNYDASYASAMRETEGMPREARGRGPLLIAAVIVIALLAVVFVVMR